MTLRPAKNMSKQPFFRRKNEQITNVFEGAMCRWHMISTDRSGAQTWKHVVRSNPVTQPTQSNNNRKDIQIWRARLNQSKPLTRTGFGR